MKNMSKMFALTLGLMIATSTMAFAETKFTPLNFDDNTPVQAKTTTSTASSTAETKGPVMLDPSQVTGGTKMQNAILQIDNAQVEVRNQLLNYKTEYSQIDSQYQTTRAQRKASMKKIKQAEKRIKNLDRAKEKIRKNFEQKANI